MVEVDEEIISHFAANHIRLKRQWLREVLAFLQANTRTRSDLINLIFHQWLFSDFELSTEANKDLHKATTIKQLREPCVFQIQSIADIGTPKLKQYKQLTDPTYDESKAELGVDFDNLDPNKGYKCFCIQISDGLNQFKAFEKKHIPELKLSTCPGSKILLFNGTPIYKDVFFLTPENCQIFGGAVEVLLRDNNFLKQLAEQLNRPLPTKTAFIDHLPPQQTSKPPVRQQIKPSQAPKQPKVVPMPTIPVRQKINQPIRSAAIPSLSAAILPAATSAQISSVSQSIHQLPLMVEDRKPLFLPSTSNFNRPIPISSLQKPPSPLPLNRINSALVSYSNSNRPIKIEPSQKVSPIRQKTRIHVDPKIVQKYEGMNIRTLTEIAKKMAYTIGCKHYSVIAIVFDVSSPFRIVENKWAMSIVLVDESQRAVECILAHELLLDLIGMTPDDALAIKSSGSAETKKKGAERITLMQEQLARLDLVFDIEVMFKQKPVIKRVQTMADRLNVV